jgi:hypothetical protein
MTSLKKQTKNNRILLWAGVIILLFGSVLTILYSSSIITATIAVIGVILVLIWRFY